MVGRNDVTGRNQYPPMVGPQPCGHRDPSRFWRCLEEGLQLLHLRGEFCSKKSFCLFEDQGCTIVYSKTKLAPLAAPTLPRLELEAACLAARRVKFVMQAFRVQVSRIVVWTDSLTAHPWIRGEPFRWKTWVRNRVTTIQAISRSLQGEWRHCPGESNPAGLATRGLSAAQP